jgi:hypothetical protein
MKKSVSVLAIVLSLASASIVVSSTAFAQYDEPIGDVYDPAYRAGALDAIQSFFDYIHCKALGLL